MNTVRDWLKCREADERQSRLESITARRHAEVRLEQGVENLADPAAEGDGIAPEPDREWLRDLPVREQALVSLLYLAYGLPPGDVVEWLAELHQIDRPQMESRLLARMQQLRESHRFARHGETLARLGVASHRSQWFTHLMYLAKDEFFRLSGTWQELEAREVESRDLPLGELDRRLREAHEQRQPAKDQALLRYAACFRRTQKWAGKRRELQELLASARVLATVPFPELAEWMRTPEKTLRNRLTQLKKTLK